MFQRYQRTAGCPDPVWTDCCRTREAVLSHYHMLKPRFFSTGRVMPSHLLSGRKKQVQGEAMELKKYCRQQGNGHHQISSLIPIIITSQLVLRQDLRQNPHRVEETSFIGDDQWWKGFRNTSRAAASPAWAAGRGWCPDPLCVGWAHGSAPPAGPLLTSFFIYCLSLSEPCTVLDTTRRQRAQDGLIPTNVHINTGTQPPQDEASAQCRQELNPCLQHQL